MNCKIYQYLLEKRKEGDLGFFSAGDIARDIDHNEGGDLFRKMNRLATKYEVVDVKVDSDRLCRVYRIKEGELKNEG